MTRSPMPSALSAAIALLLAAASSPSAPLALACDRDFDAEWADLSANGTRKVYNVGIGSLTSWASIQFSQAGSKFPSNQPVKQLKMANVSGVKKELRGCWRYQGMRALQCEPDESEKTCPHMPVVYFEVPPETWRDLRTRECGYDVFVNAKVEDDSPEGYYFAWGDKPGPKACHTPSYDYPALISQTYWDFIVGGILSWDGQLTDSGYYTWDWSAERAFGEEGMRRLVHNFPSLTYSERYKLAVDWARTTQPSPDIEWMNDRACPFTSNIPITPVELLHYEHDAFKGTEPLAIGTVSPLVSQGFYDLVDGILIEAGWADGGAANAIENRTYRCDEAAKQDFDKSGFDPNPYYNEVMGWRKAVGYPGLDSGAGEDASAADVRSVLDASAAAAVSLFAAVAVM